MSDSLAGLHVVVTRAAHQAEDLARPLRERGARVTVLPTIGIAPPSNPADLEDAARAFESFDWVVFTSANAVRALTAILQPHAAKQAKVAAVGSATRDVARSLGFNVQAMGDEYVAEALAAALGREQMNGKRILIPSAAVARDVVPNELRRMGAEVTVVEAYRNVCPPECATNAPLVFQKPLPDWALFASPSAFHNLKPLIMPGVLNDVKLGSIGPSTSAAIRHHGYSVSMEAEPQTADGLVEGLSWFQATRR